MNTLTMNYILFWLGLTLTLVSRAMEANLLLLTTFTTLPTCGPAIILGFHLALFGCGQKASFSNSDFFFHYTAGCNVFNDLQRAISRHPKLGTKSS